MPAAPPRIAVDLRALVPEPTGIGVATRSLLLALARRGRFRFLGLAHRPVRGADELRAQGIELEHEAAPLGVLWQQWRLPRRLARGDADLLWSPLNTLPVRLTVPAVVTVHDLTALLLPETHSARVRWSVLPFLARTLAGARRVVASSRATAADLRFHFPQCAGRIRVVELGVDPEFAPAAPAEVAAIRQELGCPDGYLLHVGTVEPRKNLATLLDAWQALRQEEGATPPLVLAGPYGWRSRALLRRIERLRPAGLLPLGQVERRRLVRLFQGARLFVYPSLYEGFGLPAAEAMACGVPTIVSEASSLPEVVGDAGLTVEPQDAGGLAAAIRRLLDDGELAGHLSRAGIERARRFSWERAAQGMEEVFAEALAEGPDT